MDTLLELLLTPLRGWALMLLIGVAHAEWWPAVPTIGYWWATLIAFLWPFMEFASNWRD